MKSKNSSKKLAKTKIIENEIINDFNGKIKNRTNKLTFLKKYTITDLHVSKLTGTLIPKDYFTNKEVLKLWDKKFDKNVYSSNSPHFLSRHIYTLETFNPLLKEIIYCFRMIENKIFLRFRFVFSHYN